jgi:hypothetical protein
MIEIRECFNELKQDRFKEYTENLSLINNLSDDQLEYALQTGISISENIVIQKHPNSYFNCYNNDHIIKGLMPICKLLETKLNMKLKQQLFS